MKYMHFVSTVCIAVAVMLPSSSLWAQEKIFGVTLTPPQQEQFKAINAATEPAKKAIRENTTLSEEEKRVQMKAVYDGIREKMKAILTPAQQKEMEAAFSASAKGPHKAFAAAPSKIFGVTLTPPQQEQFKAINAEAEPAKRAIRENTSLSEDEKQTQMKAVYDGIREKLKAILTPAQLKEMEAAPSTQEPHKSSPPATSKMFGVTLTPPQMEQFKAINAAAEPAKRAIRQNAALSEEEKRTQMKAVYDGIREKLKAILTPAQLKEMEGAQKK